MFHYPKQHPPIRFMLLLLLVSLLVTKWPSVAYAGTNEWTPLGPTGGTVNTLAIDPIMPTTIYAGTPNGVYKSTDGGGQWIASNSGLTDKQIYSDVYVVAIDPTTPQTLYAATFNGVYKSTTGGTSWNATTMPHNGEALVIDPKNPAIIYASWAFGVYKSTDGGATWADQSNGLNNNRVIALAIDPQTSSVLYAGTYEGLFKSTDSGASWSEVNLGSVSDKRVTAIAINPTTTSTLYLAMVEGVFKSTNSATSWSKVLSGWSNTIVLDPTKPATVYAATVDGLYKSSNSGTAWSKSNNGLIRPVRTLAINPATPSTLYVGTDETGIYKSSDSGGTWNAVNGGLRNTSIHIVIVDPQAPTTLYALSSGDVLYKSSDRGQNWSLMIPELVYGDGQRTSNINTLIIHPQTSTTIFVGTPAGPFKSTDGGVSWRWTYSCSLFCFLPYITAMTISPSEPTTVYMGSATTLFTSSSLLRSSNGGENWEYAGEGLPNADVNVIVVDPKNSARVYAGTDKGLYLTTNKGSQWTASGVGLPANSPVHTLSVNPVDPKVIFAGVAGKIFKSTDSAASWQEVSGGANGSADNDLLLDPSQPTLLYTADYQGVYKSSDDGASWSAFSAGLGKSGVNSLAIDPKTPNILYAGTGNRGVFTLRSVPVPEITTQPTSQTIDNNQQATLSVNATDNQPLTYQWYQGMSGDTSMPLSGATTNSLTTPRLTATTSYWVRVTNADGGQIDSNTAIVTVNALQAPAIQVQPVSQSVLIGQSSILSVTVTGTPPLAYQWYQGSSGDTSAPVAGATANTFTTPILTNTASYWVRVSNAQGQVDSEAALLAVLTPPSITKQPENAAVVSGTSATLRVIADGSPPLTYQWYRGISGDISSPIGNATAAEFVLPPLTVTANFWVRVSNAQGAADSDTVTITIQTSVTYFVYLPIILILASPDVTMPIDPPIGMPTQTPTPTNTPTPTDTPTFTPTPTACPTDTVMTPGGCATITPTPTFAPTPTATATHTPTATPTPTSTSENRPPVFPLPMAVEQTTQFQYDDRGFLIGAVTTIELITPPIDPDGDPLTYTWTATTGTITGNGVKATWQRVISLGQPQGGTVTVIASDERGGTATYQIIFN